MPSIDAAIMPPNTAVPTARWVAAPAPEAMTSGTRPRMKAKDVIITARKRRPAAVVAALTMSLPCARSSKSTLPAGYGFQQHRQRQDEPRLAARRLLLQRRARPHDAIARGQGRL